MIKIYFILVLYLIFSSNFTINAQIIHYSPPPDSLNLENNFYKIKIREIKTEKKQVESWVNLFEYKAFVRRDSVCMTSFVQFDFTGKVELCITPRKIPLKDIKSIDIRPLNNKIKYKKKDDGIHIILEKPQNLSVEINKDRYSNLQIFSNYPIQKILKKPNNYIYFPEGVHTPPKGDSFIIPSNSTVYIAPGAILQGTIVCKQVENVAISGRGFIINSKQGIRIEHSKKISIDGITIINPTHYSVAGGESSDIKISNLRSFSSKVWSDGLDFMSCKNITIDSVFLRNSDDCLAFYNHRWKYYGNTQNIKVKNTILWADRAHPINIGTHGNPLKAEYIENLSFDNIDILEHREPYITYQGCMAINAGDKNIVRNITFKNIRIERISQGRLFYLKVIFDKYWNKAPGGYIKNIKFENIISHINPDSKSLIQGYDSISNIQNIEFKNVRIKNQYIQPTDFYKKKYVEKIIFK